MNIKIKKAKLEDWKIIQNLNNQVFISEAKHDGDLVVDYAFSKSGVSYYKKLANSEYGNCVIAYDNDKAVGYMAMSIKDFGYRKSKYVEVENMGVDPDYRSQGIGHLLIDEAKKWAKSQNATKLYVEAYFKNDKAIKFYKREGFGEIGLELDMTI
ncbi:MAG: GCN5-related N-acetyltransferase [uncultured bacterium]|nr:MAG: GCN5-related N-acetyltransferase [uncultured bacterium]